MKQIIITFLLTISCFAAKAVIKNDGTTVHFKPDSSSKVIATLTINTVIEVSETSFYGWHNVTVNGQKGYIHANSIIMNENAKVEEENNQNPFDLKEKAIVHYYMDFLISPLSYAGQQIHSALILKLGYEGPFFDRGVSFYYGIGLSKYKIRVSAFLIDFGWKFTRYTTIGFIGGYEFLQFSNLDVQKSEPSGRSYNAPLDPHGPIFGGFLNQKFIGDKYTFVLTQAAMIENYNHKKYGNAEIYYDNPSAETKKNVKKNILMMFTLGVRFSI